MRQFQVACHNNKGLEKVCKKVEQHNLNKQIGVVIQRNHRPVESVKTGYTDAIVCMEVAGSRLTAQEVVEWLDPVR